MFFSIENKRRVSAKHLITSTMMNAYYVIKNYKMSAQELALEAYIQQQYKMSLKNMCIKLLLSLTFHKDDKGNLILLFKDDKQDKIAQLITYGNGAIPGSSILKIALGE